MNDSSRVSAMPPSRTQRELSALGPEDRRSGTTASGLKLSELRLLHCPYCESPLDLIYNADSTKYSDAKDSVENGILNCSCAQYPVLGGIPILQHTEGLGQVVALIREGDCRGALLRVMNVFRVKWARQSRWHQIRYHLNCRYVTSRNDVSFARAVDLLRRPKIFSHYLYHRFANPSLLAAFAPLLLLDSVCSDQVNTAALPSRTGGSSQRVLDLACGAGHASFLIRWLYPEINLVSIDQDFVSLYLAKRYQAAGAVFVCADTEVSSPFPNAHFAAFFCLDAFHYFHAKAAIIAELQRVVAPDGLWIFPHLHNAHQPNITAGMPLSPQAYLRLFADINPKLFPEGAILAAMSANRAFDWSNGESPDDLRGAPTLTLVGRGNRELRAQHDPLSVFCRRPRRLTINPIYSTTRDGDALRLTLDWPTESLRRECKSIEEYLPRHVMLHPNEITAIANGTLDLGAPRTRELVSRFVLVPLPEHYVN